MQSVLVMPSALYAKCPCCVVLCRNTGHPPGREFTAQGLEQQIIQRLLVAWRAGEHARAKNKIADTQNPAC